MCSQVSCFNDGSRDGCRVVGGAVAEFGQTSRLSQTLCKRIPNGFQTDESAEIGQANGYNGFDFRVLVQPLVVSLCGGPSLSNGGGGSLPFGRVAPA
jgi:hypothetical protein